MARPKDPARLYWDAKRGVWGIRDHIDGREFKRRTRHGRDARAAAEGELALHIAERERLAREALAIAPSHDDPANSNPRLVTVPAVLTFYGGRMEGTSNAAIVGNHIEHLLRHLGKLTLAQIRGDVCRAYAEDRLVEPYSRHAMPPRST